MKTKQEIVQLEIELSEATDLKDRIEIEKAIEELSALQNHRLESTFPINEDLHFDERLKQFEKEGVSWMHYKYEKKSSCLLADEPGLGKTVQVLQLIQNIREFPVLIVAPPTLCNQWFEMIDEWTEGIDAAIINSVPCELTDLNIVSYDFVSLHPKAFEAVEFAILVADEVHYLKNEETRRYSGLLMLRAEFRLGLSGTPIQNSYEELYAILFFLRISTLPGKETFYSTYVTPIKSASGNLNIEAIRQSSTAARQLQRLVSPIILRRRKAEVGMELPEKHEEVVLVKLSQAQEREYLGALNARERMVGKTAFGAIILLEQICDHPRLQDSVIIPSQSSKLCWIAKRVSLIFKLDLGCVLDMAIELGKADSAADQEYVQLHEDNSELDDELTEEADSEFDTSINKLIVFSRSLRFITLITALLTKLGLIVLVMTGDTPQQQRKQIIHQFNTEKVHVLVTSPRVGGIGLNLTAANNVIIASPAWNPAVDTQASQRTWRFGERRVVSIWRYAAAGTVEERALEKQGIKQLLSDRVLENAFETVKIRYGSVFEYVPPKREVTLRGYEEEQQVAIYEATTKKNKARSEVDYERLAGEYLDKRPFKSNSFFPPPIDQILGKMMRIVDERLKAGGTITRKELDEELTCFSEYDEEIEHCYAIVFIQDENTQLRFEPHVMNM